MDDPHKQKAKQSRDFLDVIRSRFFPGSLVIDNDDVASIAQINRQLIFHSMLSRLKFLRLLKDMLRGMDPAR